MEYYNNIIEKLKNNKFKLIYFSNKYAIKFDPHIESINYLIYKYMIDKNDNRIREIFTHIYIPEDLDIDLSNIDIADFIPYIMNIKN